jgi:hypothetical protein
MIMATCESDYSPPSFPVSLRVECQTFGVWWRAVRTTVDDAGRAVAGHRKVFPGTGGAASVLTAAVIDTQP